MKPSFAVSISISDSPDLEVLGLSDVHLRDAMVEVARHLLVAGSRLLYGGDLRTGGFTELLFELVARYGPDVDDGHEAIITNFLAWPVHKAWSKATFDEWARDIQPFGEILCLDLNGKVMSPEQRAALSPSEPRPNEWPVGLTSMRHKMNEMCDARVLLGGRVTDFRGTMPGIGEEALFALAASKPVFLIGGFGGCTRDIAETLGLIQTRQTVQQLDWRGRSQFSAFGPENLNNGLSSEENTTLAKTAHVDEAITLLVRGIRHLFYQEQNNGT